MKTANATTSCGQAGFTLIELMVGIVITMTVMAGVVQMLVVSKSNFVSGRELATTQENARYTMKYLTDEIRMAGFTGCAAPLKKAVTVTGATSSWYLNYPGIQGFEYDAGINTFPAGPASPNLTGFRSAVKVDTDAVVVRRSENTGLRLKTHNISTSLITANKPHSFVRGQVFVMSTPSCEQVTIFQMSGGSGTLGTIEHKTGIVTPGNCTKNLIGLGSFDCTNPPTSALLYPVSSNIGELHSEAYYIGVSTTDSTVPALYRKRMIVDSSTSTATTAAAEELVKGVENMQILYGLDDADPDNRDHVADSYANGSASMDWSRVVSVRLSLRMRSLLPVYNEDVAFGEFEGVAGTDGADRFMRQDVSTIITLRNQ